MSHILGQGEELRLALYTLRTIHSDLTNENTDERIRTGPMVALIAQTIRACDASLCGLSDRERDDAVNLERKARSLTD